MYRAVRCVGSASRRLVACMSVCLLLTLVLWLRCDDSFISDRITASSSSLSATAAQRHARSRSVLIARVKVVYSF